MSRKRERCRAGSPHEPASHDRQNRENHRYHSPEERVGQPGHHEGEPDQQTLDHRREPGPDERRRGHVAETDAEYLGILV